MYDGTNSLPRPCQLSVLASFFIFVYVMGEKYYVIVFLIDIS